jgi:hypothetical protein
LAGQVVEFVGLGLHDNAAQMGRILEGPVMKEKSSIVNLRILNQMCYIAGEQVIRSVHQSMHLVTLCEKELAQIRTILSGDTGYERARHEPENFPRNLMSGKRLLSTLDSCTLGVRSGISAHEAQM